MCEESYEEETATFERERQRLVEQHLGKFALVKKSEIVGIYDTEMDAVNVGFERFGEEGFFVKEIQPFDRVIDLTPFVF